MPHVTLFEMVEVNGKNTHPVFQFLRYNSSLYNESKHISAPIPWNFGKFVVDAHGGVHKFYGSGADAQIQKDIELLLTGDHPPSPKRAPSSTKLG